MGVSEEIEEDEVVYRVEDCREGVEPPSGERMSGREVG